MSTKVIIVIVKENLRADQLFKLFSHETEQELVLSYCYVIVFLIIAGFITNFIKKIQLMAKKAEVKSTRPSGGKAKVEKEITLHDAVIHLQNSIDVLAKGNLKRDQQIAELTKKLKDLKVKKDKKKKSKVAKK